MEKIKAVFRQHFPTNFSLSLFGIDLEIRDQDIEKGKGYYINITKDSRFISAKIGFDSFANYIKNHVKDQLCVQRDLILDLISRHADLKVNIEGEYLKDLIDPLSQTEDDWWFKFEYKLGLDIVSDFVKFADILFVFILLLLPYEIESEEEGTEHGTPSTCYERSLSNRALCLSYHGYNCKVCNLNMRETYKGLEKEFIHVHHLCLISEAGNNRPDPINDMVPLCPNCHSIAHLISPPYTLSQIQKMIQKGND